MNKLLLHTKLTILLSFISGFISLGVEGNVEITLDHGGKVEGETITVNVDGTEVQLNRFLGIPYAEPPINELRFAKPRRITWSDIKKAISLPRTCWQYSLGEFDQKNAGARMWGNNTAMDEDCLYLNVWAPAESKDNQRLPVMVWIYGGGFTSGSSTLDVYDGSILAATQKVVVVSMQYRVGAFGFFYLDSQNDDSDTEIAVGNMGLWDQAMALQWVQDNIEKFNGDKETVTIFGESAGAASVSILWLSPVTQSKFKRAIMESASIYARWALSNRTEANELSEKFAAACGCQTSGESRQQILGCLRGVNPSILVEKLGSITEYTANKRLETIRKCLANEKTTINPTNLPGLSTSTSLYFDTPLKPVIDGNLIPKDPDAIFEGGALNKAPELLIGTNKNEGMYFLLYGLGMKDTQFLYDNGSVVLPNSLDYAAKHQTPPGETEAADFYWITSTEFISTDWIRKGVPELPVYFYELGSNSTESDAKGLMNKLDKLVGDLDFTCPTLRFADKVSSLENAKVYVYHFDKRTEKFTMPEWLGVMHGYEIEYVFGMPYSTQFSQQFYGFNEAEKQISNEMMKLWANFARSGDPNKNADGTETSPNWPLYKGSDEPKHLTIKDSFSVEETMDQRGCTLWFKTVPETARSASECSTS